MHIMGGDAIIQRIIAPDRDNRHHIGMSKNDSAEQAVAAGFHLARSQSKRRKPNPVADALVERARKRFLYVLDTETGVESGHIDITDKKPMEIITIEAQLRALCNDDAVVRDSADDLFWSE
jgi:hypothetical protein